MGLKLIVVEQAIAFDADSGTKVTARIAAGGVSNLLS
jgi:hypothetical protein